MQAPSNIVFIKLVPSGRFEQRILEAAYVIYNTKTGEKGQTQSFVFYHQAGHTVHEDTFSDYHMAPTEADGRCLLQLCQDKDVAKHKIQDFCAAFSADIQKSFPNTTRHMTFVGDHIWQTRSLLYPFMFCQNPWIKLPKRRLIHFVEFRTFLQPFAVLHAQMDTPLELPQWVFRAGQDVNAQVNFFDNVVQASKRPIPPIRILKRGERLPDDGPAEEGEIKSAADQSDCGTSTEANCSEDVPQVSDPVTEVTCGCPETECPGGKCPNKEQCETREAPEYQCPNPDCRGDCSDGSCNDGRNASCSCRGCG